MRLAALLGSFGRNALRQPVYMGLLSVPVLMGLLLRALPALLRRFAPGFNFTVWEGAVLATAAAFPAYLYGLLAALMLLDERDAGLLPALMVTPVTRRRLLAAKVLPAALLCGFGTPLMLIIAGWDSVPGPLRLAGAGVAAMPASMVYSLLITAVAGNKVQVMTIGKIFGTVLPAPLLLSILPRPWGWPLLLLPSSGMFTVLGTSPPFLLIAGFLYMTVLAAAGWKLAYSRYFRTRD